MPNIHPFVSPDHRLKLHMEGQIDSGVWELDDLAQQAESSHCSGNSVYQAELSNYPPPNF